MNSHSTDLEATAAQYWSITDTAQTGLDLVANNACTFSAWFKLESDTSTCAILSKDGTNNRQYFFQIDPGPSAKAHMAVFSSLTTGARTDIVSSRVITTGAWHHMVFSFNGADPSNPRLLIDGTSDDSWTFGSNTFSGSIPNGGASFVIGDAFGGGAGSYFDGLLNDVRVFSINLDTTEMSSLYTNPCGYTDSDEEGRWFIADNGNDTTANNNDLTGTNSPTFSTDIGYACGGGFRSKAIFF